jgi:hypothetical protein
MADGIYLGVYRVNEGLECGLSELRQLILVFPIYGNAVREQ